MRRGLRSLMWRLHRILGRRVTVDTVHGRLTLDPALDRGAISRALYCRREYNAAQEATVLAFLRARDRLPVAGTGTIVDVGANIGLTAIGMLVRREFARAVAVEPAPGNFALLEHNVRQNRLMERMTLLPYAAAERSGSGMLAIHHRSAGAYHLRPSGPSEACPYDATADGRRSEIPIETIALDDLAADGRIPSSTALIWMDAQGAEGRIIEGASRLMGRAIPVVSEIAPKAMKNAGVTPDELCAVVESRWTRFGIIGHRTVDEHPIEHLRPLFDRWPSGARKLDVVFW
jgi:FkbM family methyltransferase